MYWQLIDREQGHCSASGDAQSSPTTENALLRGQHAYGVVAWQPELMKQAPSLKEWPW